MAASHVRIGRVEETLNKILQDQQAAKQTRDFYLQEGNKEKAEFWEGQLMYAMTISRRIMDDFKIEQVHAV